MHTGNLLAGAGLGAALMFMFDPDRGGRRRALVRDKATLATRRTRHGIEAARQDMVNRARGIAAVTRRRLSRDPSDDATLVERVRATIGRVCTHPHAIDVHAERGQVTLTGPILGADVDDVLRTAASVRGVNGLINALEVYETRDGVPSLQGEGRRAGPTLDILQRRWAPATQVLVGVGLAAAAAVGYARRRSNIH